MEDMMLTVFKCNLSIGNCSNAIKKSGDFKIWIYFDPNPEEMKRREDLLCFNISLTPATKVIDICKELSPKVNVEPQNMIMIEALLNGHLTRPLYHQELLLDVILEWTKFSEEDKRNENYLEVRTISNDPLISKVQKIIKTQNLFVPEVPLVFADKKTKSVRLCNIELMEDKLYVNCNEVELRYFNIRNIRMYAGIESKREVCNTMRWGITLIDKFDYKR